MAHLPALPASLALQALASLARHLHSSAAGEMLQGMGASLGNVVGMLQVRRVVLQSGVGRGA